MAVRSKQWRGKKSSSRYFLFEANHFWRNPSKPLSKEKQPNGGRRPWIIHLEVLLASVLAQHCYFDLKWHETSVCTERNPTSDRCVPRLPGLDSEAVGGGRDVPHRLKADHHVPPAEVQARRDGAAPGPEGINTHRLDLRAELLLSHCLAATGPYGRRDSRGLCECSNVNVCKNIRGAKKLAVGSQDCCATLLSALNSIPVRVNGDTP